MGNKGGVNVPMVLPLIAMECASLRIARVLQGSSSATTTTVFPRSGSVIRTMIVGITQMR